MAEFIGLRVERYEDKAVYLRKEFYVEGKVKKATLQLSALGIVKAYCNSQDFGNHLLTPGWTDYHKRIPYYEFDATDKLRQGKNAIGFIIGDGWAVGNIAWFGKKFYANVPMMWFRLIMEMEDGSVQTLESDNTFHANHGQIRENDLYDGEVQDARCDLGDFSSPDFVEERWYSASAFTGRTDRLEKAIAPLTVKKECFAGKLMGQVGQWLVYDFGQNHAGVPEIEITDAQEGTKLTFIYGEMLNDDGSVFTENLRGAKVTDVYYCRQGTQVFAPEMTFHGYRYMGVQITDGSCRLSKVNSRMIYTDIDFHSTFHCSDPNINQLFSNIIASQKSNFINVPTDCPQRDERLGWTGDAQVFGMSAMYNADCKAFFRKFLQDVRDGQTDKGRIDCVAPNVVADFNYTFGSPAFSDVITFMPYEHYLVYRDKSIIHENLTAAKRWVDYCVWHSDDYIRKECGYGDWLSMDEGTDKSLLGTLYMAYSAYLTSRMCAIVGDEEEQKYAQLFETVKAAFRKKFIAPDGKTTSNSQTAYVLAYSFGVMTADEIRDNLLSCIEKCGGKLATGFLGVKFLLPTLCGIGAYDLAYKLFTSTENPSWCYPVINGATTIWERWDSYVAGKGFASPTMNSFNHYALGSVEQWMFSNMLGIRYTEQGVVIKPVIDESGKITHASGACGRGENRISVQWENTSDGFTKLCLDIPKDAKLDLADYSVVKKQDERTYLIKR